MLFRTSFLELEVTRVSVYLRVLRRDWFVSRVC